VHAINYRTHAYNGQLAGRLKVSVVSTGKYVIPYFLSGFLKQNSGVELKLDVTNKAKVLENLENNEVDFSLVSVIPEQLKLSKLELMSNQLYLIGSRHSELTEPLYDQNIFTQIPLIYREQGSGTRSAMENYFFRKNITVTKKMELTSNEAVKQAVISGMGYSVMPLIGIKNELNSGELKIIPVKGFPIQSTWYLIWLKDKGFSMIAAAYLKYLEQEKENIINSQFNWTKAISESQPK
jgi:DNA-binding transcriptional LysR family regulator